MDTIKISKCKTKMIAHRGVSGIEQENTIAAFVAAGNRSYYGIETDVHQTSDGQFIIFHDDTTGRLIKENLTIEETSFERLRSLCLTDLDGSNRIDLKIPTLDEYIAVCKKYDKICFLELKNEFSLGDIRKIVSVIEKQEYISKVIFISFCLENLVRLYEINPSFHSQWLKGEWTDDTIETLIKYNLGLDIYYGSLTEERIKELKDKNIQVNIWTCDDKNKAEKYAEIGVDFITTDILE